MHVLQPQKVSWVPSQKSTCCISPTGLCNGPLNVLPAQFTHPQIPDLHIRILAPLHSIQLVSLLAYHVGARLLVFVMLLQNEPEQHSMPQLAGRNKAAAGFCCLLWGEARYWSSAIQLNRKQHAS